MPLPAVAVVVVSWNTAALLDACLVALRADQADGIADVTVVDNGSADGSARMVADRHPWVRLVESGENIGYGPAVNLGARHAVDTPWIVAANADVEVEPGALRTLVRAGEADAGIGAVAPRLLLPDGGTQHHVHPFPSLRTLAALHVPGAAALLPEGHVMEGRWNPEVGSDVDWAHGALLLLRRSAFDAVGGFDPAQWLYAEDVDIAWRLAQAGWRTRYEPTARVKHAVSAATAQAWDDEGARDDRKQAATYAWMRQRYGRRRTAGLAFAAWAAARTEAVRAEPGWRRDRALAHAARHAAGWRETLRR